MIFHEFALHRFLRKNGLFQYINDVLFPIRMITEVVLDFSGEDIRFKAMSLESLNQVDDLDVVIPFKTLCGEVYYDLTIFI